MSGARRWPARSARTRGDPADVLVPSADAASIGRVQVVGPGRVPGAGHLARSSACPRPRSRARRWPCSRACARPVRVNVLGPGRVPVLGFGRRARPRPRSRAWQAAKSARSAVARRLRGGCVPASHGRTPRSANGLASSPPCRLGITVCTSTLGRGPRATAPADRQAARSLTPSAPRTRRGGRVVGEQVVAPLCVDRCR
jgi:hypothetical protein